MLRFIIIKILNVQQSNPQKNNIILFFKKILDWNGA